MVRHVRRRLHRRAARQGQTSQTGTEREALEACAGQGQAGQQPLLDRQAAPAPAKGSAQPLLQPPPGTVILPLRAMLSETPTTNWPDPAGYSAQERAAFLRGLEPSSPPPCACACPPPELANGEGCCGAGLPWLLFGRGAAAGCLGGLPAAGCCWGCWVAGWLGGFWCTSCPSSPLPPASSSCCSCWGRGIEAFLAAAFPAGPSPFCGCCCDCCCRPAPSAAALLPPPPPPRGLGSPGGLVSRYCKSKQSVAGGGV